MPLLGRVVMGGLAIFVTWTMIRAFRSGEIFSDGRGYTLDQQPMIFAFAMVAHGFIIFFCVWLAAGYDIQSFLRLFGLEWLAAKAS